MTSQYEFLTEHETRGLLGDPAYSWRWAIALPDINGTVRQTYIGNGGAAIQSPGLAKAVKIPVGLALTVEFAPDELGVEQRYGGGTSIGVPRHDFIGATQVTFYETHDYLVTKYLSGWKSLVVDDRNNFGLPIDYKKDLVFMGFDITSNTKSLIQITQVECFPSPPAGLSYGSDNGILTVTTEFTVDGSTYTFTDSSGEDATDYTPDLLL